MRRKRRRTVLCWAAAVMLALGLAGTAAGTAAEGVTVPAVEARRFEIPDNEALAFTRSMKTGWNLGNTFDAFDCFWLQDPMEYEGAWIGGAKTTEEMIQALWDAGFRTIRIPVSWHNHVTPAEKDGEGAGWSIDEAWMSRVQTVADWAYDRGMYVILNIHHDCAPEYYYPDEAHLESSALYVRSIWSQVAARFREYGERLIFEAVNEPRLSKDPAREWVWNAQDPACLEAMDCICRLNQVFVDTVRASGGENGSRYLMVPAYDANPDYAVAEAFRLPEDSAGNRIIVSVHAYTPYAFALEMPGTASFRLENSAMKAEIGGFLNRLYERFISQGIPVVIGEFGARDKDNLQDRVNWTAFYLAQASGRGIPCLWWDNHSFRGDGENFGLLDRRTLAWHAPEILEAIQRYGSP